MALRPEPLRLTRPIRPKKKKPINEQINVTPKRLRHCSAPLSKVRTTNRNNGNIVSSIRITEINNTMTNTRTIPRAIVALCSTGSNQSPIGCTSRKQLPQPTNPTKKPHAAGAIISVTVTTLLKWIHPGKVCGSSNS